MSAFHLVRGATAPHRHRQALQAGHDQEVLDPVTAGWRVVDLSDPRPDADASSASAEYWLERATFTLTEADSDDRRVVTVPSVPAAVAELTERCQRWPQASAVCDDVLRSVGPAAPTLAGVITESLAYSTLQSGPEFARWLAERGPAWMPDIADPVLADREGDCLHVRFNRPQRHNAFSTDARAALLEALDVARYDPSITEVVLSGIGASFCSRGDPAHD